MLFIFLGFLCVVAVLLYLLYAQEKIAHTLRDEHAEMRLLLRALDSRLKLFQPEPCGSPAKEADPIAQQADALLKLDFAETPAPLADDGLKLDLDIDPQKDKKN
ncbi:MAG: hypothetical protein IJU76_13395 [Desulfovibrionaceae bacterium]|nr:hypothetical protein [Desulfovibrionaceae bacterium]